VEPKFALVIQPTNAALYICDTVNFGNFTSVTNSFNVTHANQAFDGPTTIGAEAGGAAFNGSIDEVAIFNRVLGAGELYSQYGAAVGGVAPRIFTDLQGPTAPVAAGDPIVLAIDAGGTPPLTFTWKKNGGTVATTSSGTYTIASSALTDSGTYSVVISGVGTPATSQTVPVTVISPTIPSITGSSGFKSRTIYPSGSILLSVAATGGGLKYQWYKNTAPVSGATASSFTIASVTTGDAGAYSVSVTNSLGVASNGPATFTITNPAAGSYEALVVASTPEAWWRLDETSGTNLFDGMGRHDGVYTNQNGTTPPVTFGAVGALSSDADTAVSFSPTYGGFGVVPYASTLNRNQFTVEAWVKTSVTDGNTVPMSSSYNNNGWWCRPNGGFWWGQNSAGTFGNNGNVIGQIVPDQWSHVVIEFDSSRVIGGTHYPFTLYVNGVTDGFVWGGPDTPNAGGPFIIGARGAGPASIADQLFNGQVDEVAVYGRLVPQAELQNHFNGRFGSTTPPYFVGSFLPQTVTPGKTLSYSTTVYGSTPITLQWYKGSTKIAGATTSSLTLSNVVVADSATYTLWATNGAGTASQGVNVTVIPTTGFANVTNNLVLHLRFDGNTTDTSGHNNNGTPVNAPGFVTGLIGSQALSYATSTNGSGIVDNSSYVVLGRPSDLQLDGSTSFSVSLWVNQTNGAENGDLPFIGTETNSANNPGWILCPSYHAGGWQWDLNDGVNNIDINGPNDSINNAQWHHFLLSVDRSSHFASTYVDGVLVGQTDISSLGNIDNGGPVVIGQDPTGLYPEAGGFMLDDIGLWRRALTPLEAAQIESAGRSAGHSFDTVSPTVTMTISKSGSSVTISWPSGTLYQSDSVGPGAVWTAVAGASAPSYTFTPTGSSKYYRVQ
jgi:Concanavalin A-like lectin/glucanases superfamily/Immunoglobulin I-set domain